MIVPDTTRTDDPWAYDANARIALALSILGHRTFCTDCAGHVEQAVLALRGATIDELQEMTD
jgi:hypothetical protein